MKNQIVDRRVASKVMGFGDEHNQVSSRETPKEASGHNNTQLGMSKKMEPEAKMHVNREENDGRDDIL